ncbi:MAG: aldo/keto reductase [Xanthomonadaceae bacterium]|nr:aldo/keto reductase [Xanthomonadaceae bacterium]
MEYTNLGRSGLMISKMSFGSWVTFGSQVDLSASKKMIKTAYDAGVNFFDNAEVYANGESERLMGQAFKDLDFGRDTYTVSSKVFWGGEKPTQVGLSCKHIRDACDAALKRLQVDYLDLFFCHRPDVYTPVEETVNAMSDLVRSGKILYWGTSEWGAQALTEAFGIAEKYNLVKPTMEQPQYNIFERDKVEGDYSPLFKTFGLGTTIWSPLASGLLSGKYANGIPKDSRVTLPGYEWLKARFESEEGAKKIEQTVRLGHIAKKLGTTLPRMSIAWCLKNPNVSSVILGASRVEQLEENLKSLADVKLLDGHVMEEIESIVQNKPKAQSDFR